MVVERFRNQDAKATYRCFQLMQCDGVTLLPRWVAEWSHVVTFEIVRVVEGKATAAALAAQL